MPVKSDFSFVPETFPQGGDALRDLVRQQITRRIGDIDAIGTITFHQPRLLQKRRGLRHMSHHQESDGIQFKFPRQSDVLLRDIGFRTVGRDAHGADTAIPRHAQMVDGADSR